MSNYRVTVWGTHGFKGSVCAGNFSASTPEKADERARFHFFAALDAPCLVELQPEVLP